MITNKTVENNQNIIVGKFTKVQGVTGNIVNNLGLSSADYNSSDLLDGTLTIVFNRGDFLPLNTSFSFRIYAQYPVDYVCSDGTVYEWKDINGQDVSPSPINLCGEIEEMNYSCTIFLLKRML